MAKKKTLKFNFGQKHVDYIRAAEAAFLSVAEGAIRSGKTTDNVYAFAHMLKYTPDRFHLATGSTIANAKLNIGECDGLGLEHIFRGQCRWGKFRDNDALIINGLDTNRKDKIVIFAGGAKADSFKRFRGNSYGGWIATEINQHHDNTIKEAFNRTVAAKVRRIFWDLNPDNPGAAIYRDYIDKYAKMQEDGALLGGYNYQKFTLRDNINLSADRLAQIESQYVPGTVWHSRDILGMRCRAEGLIYGVFANDVEKYLTATPDYDYIQIGVDFGGNGSAHTFVATGLKNDYSILTALRSERWDAKGTDAGFICDKFNAFVERVQKDYGQVRIAYADSAEQVLINSMRGHSPLSIRNSLKQPIIDRIRATVALIGSGRFFYTKDCETLRDALCNAVYDDKKMNDERLDDGTSDIDSLDAFEYSFERYLRGYSRLCVE